MNPKDYIRASNGDGEAVRAIVTENRGIGNLALVVDSVLNWPHKFFATAGTVVDDELDPETVTVFRGHLDGSIIMIEEFSPGYSDIGNLENQVVVLKPTTPWADAVAEAMEQPGLPPGGVTGQVLTKISNDDGDAEWEDSASNSTWVFNQVPSGLINSSNTTFTLPSDASNVILSLNGLVLRPGEGNDYVITGNTITMLYAPPTGSNFLATYTTTSNAVIQGSNSIAWKELVAGVKNGTNPTFTTLGGRPYIGGSLQVYVNGVAQGSSVTETNPATGTFTLDFNPVSTDEIEVSYQFVNAVTGNADTVDGIHASAVPVANTLLPLDNNKILRTISIGSTLAVAENTASLTWNGTTKQMWSLGTWNQYGPMARTTAKHLISITVPVGKRYTVDLSHLCATVQSPNGNWGASGIGKLASGAGALTTILSSSINANGDNYHPQTSGVVQVLDAGTHDFCVWVVTANTGSSNVWHGTGNSTLMTNDWAMGRSCVFKAVLLNVEDV